MGMMNVEGGGMPSQTHGDATNAGDVTHGKTDIHFSAAEIAFYRNLWTTVTPDTSDKLYGSHAVEFMERSSIPREILHQIWCAVDPGQQGYLKFDAFCMALRLIAHAQSNPAASALTTELMLQEPPSLPNFQGVQRRRSPSEYSDSPDVAQVTDDVPRVMGSTLDPIRPRSTSYPAEDAYVLRPTDLRKYASLFLKHDFNGNGFVQGADARDLLLRSGLSKEELAEVWRMSDVDTDGRLSFREFLVALHLVTVANKKGRAIPKRLPEELDLIFDANYHIDTPESIVQQPRSTSRSVSPVRQDDVHRSASGRTPSPTMSFAPDPMQVRHRGRSPTSRNLPSFGYEAQQPSEHPENSRDVQRLDAIIEADRRLARYLMREVDAINENVQTLKDIAATVERETRREARDRDRLRQQQDDLVRQLAFSKRRLENLKEERHRLSLETISIRRDRDHYSEEAAFLARAVEAAQKDLSLFCESEMQLDKSFHQCDAQAQELDRKRHDVLEELKQEKDRMRQDERTNAELKAKINRLQNEMQTCFPPEILPREKPRKMKLPEQRKNELQFEPPSTDHSWSSFLRAEADRPGTSGEQAPMQYERPTPMTSFREGV